MKRLTVSLPTAVAGAVLAIALAAGGCHATSDISPQIEALTNKVQAIGDTVTQTQAIVSKVDNSTNNWSTPALIIAIGAPTAVLLVVLVGIGYLGAKAFGVKFGIIDWIDRMRFKRNGG
jgi:hypothetical protein